VAGINLLCGQKNFMNHIKLDNYCVFADDVCMITYMDTLIAKSTDANVKLKQAFVHAGVPDSTFYRAKHGAELRHDTANKVEKAIEELSTLQKRNTCD